MRKEQHYPYLCHIPIIRTSSDIIDHTRQNNLIDNREEYDKIVANIHWWIRHLKKKIRVMDFERRRIKLRLLLISHEIDKIMWPEYIVIFNKDHCDMEISICRSEKKAEFCIITLKDITFFLRYYRTVAYARENKKIGK